MSYGLVKGAEEQEREEDVEHEPARGQLPDPALVRLRVEGSVPLVLGRRDGRACRGHDWLLDQPNVGGKGSVGNWTREKRQVHGASMLAKRSECG